MDNPMVPFKHFTDERGSLVSLEGLRNVPFEIKRVYYMTGLKPGEPRGFHAHKKLRQLAICLHGRCRMLLDDGKEKKEVLLSTAHEGALIDPMVWHEMHDFSEGTVLLVLADDVYDESDYIRDFSKFLSAF